MKNILLYAILPFLLAISACKTVSKTDFTTISDKIIDIAVPTSHSGEPNLFATKDKLYMSWIEHINDSMRALMFSKLVNDAWEQPKIIAKGTNWFVNWADFPSLAVFADDKTMIAHWLQKSAKGTYTYDIHLSQSFDEGKTWQNPFLLNRDSVQAEHGFVSFEPLPNNTMFATWLDGRNTKQGEGHEHHEAMTLRSAIIDAKGSISKEVELDEKVCDCCQTATTLTKKGVVVAYRNRSEQEVRDIHVLREVQGQWLMPKPVNSDNWQINGCPVNGPAIYALENNIALVWYTAAFGQPQVNLAFSQDAGNHFGKPIRINSDKTIGRVDVILSEKSNALISFMEENGDKADIKLAIVNSKGLKIKEKTIATTSIARKSGFPRIAKIGNTIYVAWTEVLDNKTVVKTKKWDLFQH